MRRGTSPTVITLLGIALGCGMASLVLIGILYTAIAPRIALGAEPVPVNRVEVPAVQRVVLTREAQRVFGPDAPVARFAAQIHTESTWRPGVCSYAGACGLGQFMPATAEWLAEQHPEKLKPVKLADWQWSVRALVIYDWRLVEGEVGWSDISNRWAAALTAYVGGAGWVRRERRATAAAGDDPDRWWGSVERHCLRGPRACRDSRHYPRRILCQLEPEYIEAGWPGRALQCGGES
jgi:soluble lytic murein transglycosylase-like protein